MPRSATKTEVKVKIDIRPGPASPAQKAVWGKFWQKLIAEAKENPKGGNISA